jgi:hypothetical protein
VIPLEEIAVLIENVELLTDEAQADGHDYYTADVLDYLAITGMKLVKCGEGDFDEAGVSVASHAHRTHLVRLSEETPDG